MARLPTSAKTLSNSCCRPGPRCVNSTSERARTPPGAWLGRMAQPPPGELEAGISLDVSIREGERLGIKPSSYGRENGTESADDTQHSKRRYLDAQSIHGDTVRVQARTPCRPPPPPWWQRQPPPRYTDCPVTQEPARMGQQAEALLHGFGSKLL